MAVSALFQALIAVLKYIADPIDVLPVITFWLMGGLGRVTGADVLHVTGPVLVALALVWALRWQLNVLSLGDDEARALGVRVAGVRTLLIMAATLMTAAVVSISGIVAWVGLLVPHMARISLDRGICGFIDPALPRTCPVCRSHRCPATVVEPTSNATPSATSWNPGHIAVIVAPS